MTKHELTEGEARLLVAVFDHLKPYYERAKANKTSVAAEMNKADDKILETYYGLLTKMLTRNPLNYREYKIIMQRYGLPPYLKSFTREESAQDFDVTCERIRRLEAKALKKIKRCMTELNDEETRRAIDALANKAQEAADRAAAAVAEGDPISEVACMHRQAVCISAISKIKIQQAIRRHRDQNGKYRSNDE